MDALIPPLVGAVQSLRVMIAGGRSPKEAFRIYLHENNDELAASYRERWIVKTSTSVAHPAANPIRGVYARALWDLIERGVAGEPILVALTGLEDEATRAARAELDLHLSTLPFKMLIPLLLFQFPAHLLLLLGPVLRDLTRTLGGA